jgi:Double-stranded RNA binding motif
LKQNKKLFKMLIPRNAIAALNELQGSVSETTVLPVQGNKFEAEVTLNNVCYKGIGNSKMQAKNAACEKALRDLVINKFQQMKNREGSTEDISMEDETDSTDVPMLQLASFALHKLFAEWESEGFEIPLPKVNVNNFSHHC